jgi:type IV secretory pathway TrbL component
MMLLVETNLIPLLIALAIGLATGWWAFRHRRNL